MQNWKYLQKFKINKHLVSNKLEEAYSRVADLYVKHQRNWDSADSVEIINFTDDEEDMEAGDLQALLNLEDEENRSDMEDDVFMGDM